MKDKLAAARSGGVSTPTAAKPAPKPAVEPRITPPAEIREPKALAEALRKKAEAAEKAPASAIKKVEPEPPKSKGRRGLLVVGVVAAAMAAGLAWLVKRVASEPRVRVRVGPSSMFKEGSLVESPDWDFRVLRRGDRIVALRSACTHLGCPTRWSPVESKFLCPCHGSAFDADGINIAGPRAPGRWSGTRCRSAATARSSSTAPGRSARTWANGTTPPAS